LPDTEMSRAAESLRKTVEQLVIDVWQGRDKHNPSITARLASLEDCVDRIEKAAEHHRTRTEKKTDITLAAVLGLVATVLMEIMFRR
jgi:hypothetical protein